MDLNSQSLEADALANLYRAAFCLAKKDPQTGIDFLSKAISFWQADSEKNFFELKPLLKNYRESLASPSQQLFWAEKILDCYHLLKSS